MSSLNRQEDGTVTAGNITVNRNNLSTDAAVTAVAAVTGGAATGAAEGAIGIGTAAPTASGGTSLITINGGAGAVTEGSTYGLDVGGTTFTYTAAAGDDINAVNEGTQMEVVFSVEKISENRLIPVLEAILNTFPFVAVASQSSR